MAEKNQPRRRGLPNIRGRGRRPAESTDPAARALELQQELFRLRFQLAARQLTNTARIRQVRREIARWKTIQRQRDLMAAGQAAEQ